MTIDRAIIIIKSRINKEETNTEITKGAEEQ